jgi:Hg(II)-responsive transcriptional regulator
MQTLTTGQLAKEANVNIQTIRYYERVGLLPDTPRRESGYRQFSQVDVTRILFIKHAQQAGFLLKEIKELFALKVNTDSACEEVKERAESKIVEIDEKIRKLEMMKQTLKTLTSMCSEPGAKSECPILEAFESEDFEVAS